MLTNFLYSLVRPLLFSLDSERAHHVTLHQLKNSHRLGLIRCIAQTIPTTPCKIMGIDFPNRVGLAAGLDKNGEYIDALGSLGFGFIEIGTVTPKAQNGNPQPRMFRLPKVNAVINRMGFNNLGLDALINNVSNAQYRGILGLNIGKNAATPIKNALDDYLIGLRAVYRYASYVTVNISSPNTKNLRQLQGANELDHLLAPLKLEQAKLTQQYSRYVPLALKIAPDLDNDQIITIADALLRHQIDGVIATNTTLARDKVTGLPHAEESGGLSGSPVLERSNHVIRTLKTQLRDDIPIIGVGGVLSGQDAQSKIEAGAKLIQLYTGLIYRGPGLIRECADALLKV